MTVTDYFLHVSVHINFSILYKTFLQSTTFMQKLHAFNKSYFYATSKLIGG